MRGFLVVGVAAWLVEVALCFSRGLGWYLRFYEPLWFMAAALWLPALLVAMGEGLLWLSRRPMEVRRATTAAAALAAAGAGLWVGALLTAGRRARELPLRPLLVAACGLTAGLGLWAAVRVVSRLRCASDPWRFAGAALFVLAAAACGVCDQWILPRGYPPFHLGLSALAIALFVCAASSLPDLNWKGLPSRTVRLAWGAALIGLLSTITLARSVNAGFATEYASPWTGKLVHAYNALPMGPDLDPRSSSAAAVLRARSTRPGIDLRDRDVLLITVDALRADALGAYGGEVGTPEMDALAAEGMVFERAYTPTPHTSYALSSLLTAKPLREVMALEGASQDPPALPDLLRRYGYRTAAFYPPAIFYVDGARFEALSGRGFGFEYQKRMFASAQDRVKQVREYLARAPAERPVFVWVHLFEPHEPYAAPEGEPESDAPRHLYDAEVRYVDGAVGALVRSFRESRPGATVVLSADHGEEFGEHGGRFHGSTLYDEQVRVPLLWSSPGSVAPGRSFAPVELYDVTTTLLAAAGIPPEARMRGDDVGEVLAGTGPGPSFAFSTVQDRVMVVDRRMKAVCRANQGQCRLYDLEEDPGERTNLAGTRQGELERLQAALGAHLGGIAEGEMTSLAEGVAWPDALVRARLGVAEVAPELLPLLSDTRPAVRAAAARALGELRYVAAQRALSRVRGADPDAEVRREAALASCVLGVADGCEAALSLLASRDRALSRRAATLLAIAGRAEGAEVLIALAADAAAEEADRLQAIQSLRSLGTRDAEPVLITLLEEVRLRAPAALALGDLGSERAVKALEARLARERYPAPRAAEARALLRLGSARAVPLIRRMLGTETSLPGGVDMLVEAGVLGIRPTPEGAQLVAGSKVLRGAWSCSPTQGETPPGCVPGDAARLALPRGALHRRPVRLWVQLSADAAGSVTLAGQTLPVPAGRSQRGIELSRLSGPLTVSVTGPVRLHALTVVAQRPDIAPPTPEPWLPEDGPQSPAAADASERSHKHESGSHRE